MSEKQEPHEAYVTGLEHGYKSTEVVIIPLAKWQEIQRKLATLEEIQRIAIQSRIHREETE